MSVRRIPNPSENLFKPPSSVTLENNGEAALVFVSNTELAFKYRGSDSVTRTFPLTLSGGGGGGTADGNTTYDISAADGTGGKKLIRLTAGGSGSGTDDVALVPGSGITLSRSNDEITIALSSAADVSGPASSTDNAVARYDLTTGKIIQSSSVTISDAGAIVAPQAASCIPFYHATQGTFPTASTNLGGLAYSQADGYMYYAHGSAWNAIAKLTDIANITYSVSAADGTTGKKLIKLTGSNASEDSVALVQGTGITLTRSSDEITINADTAALYADTPGGNQAEIVLQRSADDDRVSLVGAGGLVVTQLNSTTIQLEAASSSVSSVTQYTDELAQDAVANLFAAGTHTGITFTYNDNSNSMSAVVTSAGGGTTYDLTGTNTTTNQAILNLVPSSGLTDSIEIVGGGATSVAWNSVNKRITITSTDTNTDTNTTYALSTLDGATAAKKVIRLTGSDAATSNVTLVAGSNVSLTRAGDEITIASSYIDTNTTYSISAETPTGGGAAVRLTNSGGGTDEVAFVAGTGISITRTNADVITITNTGSGVGGSGDGNTTYTISTADGSNTSEKVIRLTAANPSSTDDVTLVAGTGIALSQASDKITIQQSNSRSGLSATTATLSNDATGELNITGYKTYALLKVQTSAAAWVRIYSDNASRSADSTRSEGQDPAPGSGLLAEIRTAGAETQVITPGLIGWNNDSPLTDNIYMYVTNRSGSSAAITVTLTALRLEV